MFEIHAFHPRFLSGVLNVLAQSMLADSISEARFTEHVLLDPNFRTEGAPVAVQNGEVVGFCLGIARHVPLENAPSDADRGYITLLGVLPEARRNGVATRLLEHVEGYFRAQQRNLVMVSAYAPNYFIPGIDVNAYADGLAFFASQSYTEVYRPLAMQTSLWTAQRPTWVETKKREFLHLGGQVLPYTPELTLPLLDFAAREFQGDWVRYVREAARQIVNGDSNTRLICVTQNGEVLGFAHYNKERFGPIGVAATQRGRGLGQILMWETLYAQRAQGFRSSWFLWSDDPTAARIYTGAGFEEVRRFALLKKSLIAA